MHVIKPYGKFIDVGGVAVLGIMQNFDKCHIYIFFNFKLRHVHLFESIHKYHRHRCGW